ncbi:MAG: hypothetical protein JXA97_10015 [Anaerolineales bacterium]|nr:hypothetical protein [Anaerolineales bacterium]
MQDTIILIGPMCAGKTTIAKLLAGELGTPRVELDELRWDYYPEAGYDDEEARRIHAHSGNLGVLAYCKPFEVHAVERVLQDHPGAVIDFGAGHTVQENPALLKRLQRALAPHPHVILLLPASDPEDSIRILNQRFRTLLEREVGAVDERLLELNARFVRHPANQLLAKVVICTEGETPEETCGRIRALIEN